MIEFNSERQLPPSDRTEKMEPGIGDLELHEQISTRLGPDFSQSDLAREIGVSATAVNQWVNHKPLGDVADLEFKLRYWLETIDDRVDLQRDIKPTAVTRRVENILRSISRTNDMGIVTGRAGIGKTCGLQLYRLQDKMSILLTADHAHGNTPCMVEDLWVASRTRRRQDDPTGKNDVLIRRFAGSNRLIMIDNCHSLTKGGLKWAYAFHNRTGCPVALVGNPLVAEKILKLPDEDQYTTRTGQYRAVTVSGLKDAEELASLLLDQYSPALKRDLLAQGAKVCQERGFARRLKKQLRLTMEILDGGLDDGKAIKTLRARGMTDPQIAFSLAASQLLDAENRGGGAR